MKNASKPDNMSEIKNIPIAKIETNKGQIEGLPKNPRFIKDYRFEALKKSISDAPDMLELRELIVFPNGDKFVAVCGNMRLRACKELGFNDVPCKVLPADTPTKKLREIAIKDNTPFGTDDTDILANEWDESELIEWGMELPQWNIEDDENADCEPIDNKEDDEYERKKREFEEKIKRGEISEEDEEYQEFLEKFEPKKTTDDCYTPELVYNAVEDHVAKRYNLSKAFFMRPFYPGGDYKKENYERNEIVVDNPPFSIITEIVNWYNSKGIKFFLFAPHLTLFSSGKKSVCYIPVGVPITYENGALVNTSFITNLENEDIQLRTDPELYKAVKEANEENQKAKHKELPKYNYPKELVTTPLFQAFSRFGIEFEVKKNECAFVRQLESQKQAGKAIFGGGFLLSSERKAEREKAEREKAEREKAEREKAEREKAEREKAEREKADVWLLSDNEKKIISELDKKLRKQPQPAPKETATD